MKKGYMKPLDSSELKVFLEYVERTLFYIGDVDCGPNEPEFCKAAAACLILKDWLPEEIRETEEFEARPDEYFD